MKIKLKHLIGILDENYQKITSLMSREEILILDRATSDVEYCGTGECYYSPDSMFGERLSSIGLTEDVICSLASGSIHANACLPDQARQQVQILKELLCSTKEQEKSFRKHEQRIYSKLLRMSQQQMLASLRSVKVGQKSIEDWLDEKNVFSDRDKEYNNFIGRTR